MSGTISDTVDPGGEMASPLGGIRDNLANPVATSKLSLTPFSVGEQTTGVDVSVARVPVQNGQAGKITGTHIKAPMNAIEPVPETTMGPVIEPWMSSEL